MIERFLAAAVGYAWGWPLVALLVGGGAFLTLRSRFLPFLAARHAYEVVRGRYDDPDDPGEVSHAQALSTALAATIGVGNIAGVAVAITQGGPGAVFWMWVSAVVGMATKFFDCTLAVLYRKPDEDGVPQGGPMYFMEVGLGPRFKPLAVFFSACGLLGCLCLFQANQLAEVLESSHGVPRPLTGLLATALVAVVVLGGVRRIGRVAERLVPAMCLVYLGACLAVLAVRWDRLGAVLASILHDAFRGTAAAGGAAGIAVSQAIITGIKRAAFSNEAGIGTAPMAHGAAKTREPVREGLVAMVGPFVDTIVVCTLTALVILSAGEWRGGSVQGVALTARAFAGALGPAGRWLVTASVALFALSTMFGYAYYGRKCFAYLFGKRRARAYEWFFILSIALGAAWSAEAVINFVDTAMALMAFPNMIAALLLSGRVMEAARDYFRRHPEAIARPARWAAPAAPYPEETGTQPAGAPGTGRPGAPGRASP